MKILARFLRLLQPHRRYGIGIALGLLASSGLTVGTPFLYRRLVDYGILKGDVSNLLWMLGLILLATALQEALYLMQAALSSRIRKKVFARLRMDLYAHLLRMPQAYFQDHPQGKLMARIISDVNAVQHMMLERYVYFFQSLIVGLLVLILVSIISPRMVLAAFITIPLLIGLYLYFRKSLSALSRDAQVKHENMMARLQEDLSMVKAIQSFSMLGERIRKTQTVMDEHEEAKRKMFMHSSGAYSSTTVINLTGIAVIWGIGGMQVLHGSMTMGTLIAISFYLTYMINLFFNAYYTVIGLETSVPAAERIFEILDAPAVIEDHPDARDIPDQEKATVRFRGVSFGYRDGPLIFSGINLAIGSGELVGVAGKSGEGKTTLANLLMRYFDPSEGTIEINGADIRRIRLDSLRKYVGMVPQEDCLFDQSIRDNITLGRKGISDEKWRQVCRVAGLAFVEKLENGWDTMVGERGARLSGGQKKRISIARALLDDPRILIFDEATGSLDEETENEILEGIRTLARDRIVLLITHKKSNLKFASKIIHLRDGRLTFYESYDNFSQNMTADAENR